MLERVSPTTTTNATKRANEDNDNNSDQEGYELHKQKLVFCSGIGGMYD